MLALCLTRACLNFRSSHLEFSHASERVNDSCGFTSPCAHYSQLMPSTTRPRTRPSRKNTIGEDKHTDQEPPACGWKSSSGNIEHGKLYLSLLQSGAVRPISNPPWVFDSYQILHGVAHEYFPKFKQNYVAKFYRIQKVKPKKETDKIKETMIEWEDTDRDQFDDTDLLCLVSPASSVKKQPSRMTDYLDYIGFDGTPCDALTSNGDVRPLAPLSTLHTRNQ